MHIAIVGKQYAGLLSYMNSNGISYTLFVDTKGSVNSAKDDHTEYVDFSSKTHVINFIKQKHEQKSFDAVVSLYEQYILITSEIAQALELPGLSTESAKACTDKSIMRQLFSKAPKKISPDFRRVFSIRDVENFASSHMFPLILKPANLAKSLMVTKNDSLEELRQNYAKMIKIADEVYSKYAPHNEQIMLIEEFLDGTIHSVDAYVDSDGNPSILPFIVDYQTGYDIGYNDNFHYSRILPSKLSIKDQEDFFETTKIAIKSLGMKNCAAHVEIIMTKEGPRIVEIGARNGGYRERMHGAAQGIDIYENLLKTLTNQPVNISASRNEPCAVLELFPRYEGTFIEIKNEEKLRKLESTKYISKKYTKGQFIGKSSSGYKTACVIMLHNQDPKKFQKDLDFVNNSVEIITKYSI